MKLSTLVSLESGSIVLTSLVPLVYTCHIFKVIGSM